MKEITPDQIDRLPGRQLAEGDTFCFSCHPGIGCFNRCCRNLNLFLYPYDVVRLKNRLEISSEQFLDQYVDVVLRSGDVFPEVLLRMAENEERSCIFVTEQGCSVYGDRPDTCRKFPVEKGVLYSAGNRKPESVFFYKPPDFCEGQYEEKVWTIDEWANDEEAKVYNRMTAQWAELRRMFLQQNPWGAEGPQGPKAKMAFMTAYNIDQFRDFVFNSSFLKRYKIKKDLQRKLRRSDTELLLLGFDWIRFYLWGIRPKSFRIK